MTDTHYVPTNIPSGHYILSWRWDTEQGPQIWSQCSDVYIIDEYETLSPTPEVITAPTPNVLVPGCYDVDFASVSTIYTV